MKELTPVNKKVLKRHRRNRRHSTKVRKKEQLFKRTIKRTPREQALLKAQTVKNALAGVITEHNDKLAIKSSSGVNKKHRKQKLMRKSHGGKVYSMRALYTALRKVERELDKVPIFEHFIQRAYSNDNMLKALMGKLLPDLKSVEATIQDESPYKLVLHVGVPKADDGTSVAHSIDKYPIVEAETE